MSECVCLLLLLPPSSSLPVLFLFPLPSFSLISPPLSVGPILCSIQCCSGQHCREALRVPLQGELTLCACVCVCMCALSSVHTCVCVCVCVCVRACMHSSTVHSCVCVCVHSFVRMCVCVYLRPACVFVCVRACVCA